MRVTAVVLFGDTIVQRCRLRRLLTIGSGRDARGRRPHLRVSPELVRGRVPLLLRDGGRVWLRRADGSVQKVEPDDQIELQLGAVVRVAVHATKRTRFRRFAWHRWSKAAWATSAVLHALLLSTLLLPPPQAGAFVAQHRTGPLRRGVATLLDGGPRHSDQNPAWFFESTQQRIQGPARSRRRHRPIKTPIRPDQGEGVIAAAMARMGETAGIATGPVFDGATKQALGGLSNGRGSNSGEFYGVGGLGVVGTGCRGGCSSGYSTVRLGRAGRIGRPDRGGGYLGHGRIGGDLRGRVGGRVVIACGTQPGAPGVSAHCGGKALVTGALDKELIRRVVRRHLNQVKFCYERELSRVAELSGKVTLRFVIGPQGRVVTSSVETSTLGNRRVEQCLTLAVRRWLFPRPRNGGVVIVRYPFLLRIAGS